MTSFVVTDNNANKLCFKCFPVHQTQFQRYAKERESVHAFRNSSALAFSFAFTYWPSGALHSNFIQFPSSRKVLVRFGAQLLFPASSYNAGLEFQPWLNEILHSVVVPFCVCSLTFHPRSACFLKHPVNRYIQSYYFPPKEYWVPVTTPSQNHCWFVLTHNPVTVMG